ncbi:MAG: GAF domain-containing sensor histidine kinase [Marinilabiliaceae bacterium]|nr:GAF domain-containing sensor histidine kinase [Marinilabiliaceae bacterium]
MTFNFTCIRFFKWILIVFFFSLINVVIDSIAHNIPLNDIIKSSHFYYTSLAIGIIISIGSILYWRDRDKKQQSINQYSKNLKALLDVNSSFISTLNLNELMQIIVDQSTKFIKLETGAIYLLKENRLYLASTTPPLPNNFPDEFRRDDLINHPHIQEALSTNQTLYIPDISKAELSESEIKIIKQRQLKTLLYIPLIVEKRPVGVLILGTVTSPRKLLTHEIEMCNAFSGEAALAIENARLFKNSAEYAKRLEIQNAEIQIINTTLNEKNKKIEQINEELIEAKKIAEESDRLKTAFLNNISHEIRTPLNAVVGFANLIADDSNPIDRIKDYSTAILNSSDRLLEVISDVIITSQIHTEQIKTFLSDFDIHRLINMTSERLRILAQNKGICFNIKNNIVPYPLFIHSDISKLEKIIYHITTNAIKFTHKGTVELSFNIKNDKLIFTCTDNGIGVETQYHELIFEPFRQIQIEKSYEYEGNGLGLTITKAYVNLLNGIINFDSKPNKGTNVRIEIPVIHKQTSN